MCVEMWISNDCYTGGTKYRTKRRETTKCCGMSDVGRVDKCRKLPTAVVEGVWTSRGETTVRRFSRALSSSLAAMARHVERAPKCVSLCKGSCRGVATSAIACSLASLRALCLMAGSLPSRTLVQMSLRGNTSPPPMVFTNNLRLICLL